MMPMKIIAKGRGRGKTTELLAIAQENQYAFVCCHQQEVRRLKAMQIDIPINLSFHEFKTYRLRGRALNGIVIDDADMCIFNTIWTEKWEDSHTEELIKLSAKHWKYISVFDRYVNSNKTIHLAHDIVRQADKLWLDIPFPIVHGESCAVKPVLFHDPEFYLQAITGRNPVKYATVSELNTIHLEKEARSLFR
jgi:hypothetical protein